MIKPKITFLIILFFSCSYAFTQVDSSTLLFNDLTDYEQNALNGYTNDKMRINYILWQDNGLHSSISRQKESLKLAKYGLYLSNQINYYRKGEVLYYIGKLNYEDRNYADAVKYAKQALDEFQKKKENHTYTAHCYLLIGKCFYDQTSSYYKNTDLNRDSVFLQAVNRIFKQRDWEKYKEDNLVDFRYAEVMFDSVITISLKYKYEFGLINAFYEKYRCMVELGYESQEINAKISEILDSYPDNKGKAKFLNVLSLKFTEISLPQAEFILNQAKKLSTVKTYKDQLANSLHIESLIQLIRGDFEVARKIGNEALTMKSQSMDTLGLVVSNSILGLFAFHEGNYKESYSYFQNALELFLAQSNVDFRSAFHLIPILQGALKEIDFIQGRIKSQQEYYTWQGMIPESYWLMISSWGVNDSYLDEDLVMQDTVYKDSTMSINSISMRSSLDDFARPAYYMAGGFLHLSHRNFEKSLSLFINALGLNTKLNNDYIKELFTGIFDNTHYSSVLLNEQTGNELGKANSFFRLGNKYLSEEKYDYAIWSFYNSNYYYNKINFLPGIAWSIGNIGIVLHEKGYYVEASLFFDKSIDLIENSMLSITGEFSKHLIFDKSEVIYEYATECALLLGQHDKAYSQIEAQKARGLNDFLARSFLKRTALNDNLVLQEFDSISFEIKRLEKELKGNIPLDLKNKLEYDRKEKISHFKDKLITTSSQDIFRYKNISYPKIASVEQIQENLKQDEVLIQYSLGKVKAIAFLITKDTMFDVQLGSSMEIRNAVNNLRNKYINICKKVYFEGDLFLQSTLNSSFFKFSSSLYENLIAPLDSITLIGGKQLILIPDDELNYMPFELLVRDDKEKDFADYNYLIKDNSIAYFPSATTFYLSRISIERKQFETTFMAFGAPNAESSSLSNNNKALNISYKSRGGDISLADLPHALEEINSIKDLFSKKKRKIYTGKNASESNLKSLFKRSNSQQHSSKSQFIHFATHAVIDTIYPEDSAIVLAQDKENNDEDGFLRLFEFFGLDLSADLIVLSACETGMGRNLKGEGITGFSRALMYSGTNSMILSLWPVADKSTAKLFINFYDLLINEKKSKGAALKKAQLKMIQNSREPKYSNPFFWAPFILMGES